MYLMFLFTQNLGAAFIDFFDILVGGVLVDGFGALLETLGAPDWRVKNHGAWARQWRPEELRRALASSRDAEQAMKSGSDPDEVFYRWLVETLKR